MHDIDLVTDRYLRRFGEPIDRGGTKFVWPHDTFHWAATRADLSATRVAHGFRNSGLSMKRFGRITVATTEAIERFAASFRR